MLAQMENQDCVLCNFKHSSEPTINIVVLNHGYVALKTGATSAGQIYIPCRWP